MGSRFEEGWRGRLVKCSRCGKISLFRGTCRKCGQSLVDSV